MATKESKNSGLPKIPRVSDMPEIKRESFFKKHKEILFKLWVPLSILLVFLLLVPTKTVFKDVEVSYTGEEEYTAEVAYQEEVPFQVKYWEVSDSKCVEDPDCLCIRRSNDTGDCMRCSCNVAINSTRDIPSFTVLTVMKNVTKYREETKIRSAAKTKIEKQETEVNWVFGHAMPYKLHLPLIS